ncbi:hypothetical protein D0Z03_001319 [Geotrichum reessii]|nr:hypothetical protein D0Z03_001319 [Galactomyces reessii]
MSKPSPVASVEAVHSAESPASQADAPNLSEPENTNLFLEHPPHHEVADPTIVITPADGAAAGTEVVETDSAQVSVKTVTNAIETDEERDKDNEESERKKRKIETDYDTELMDLNDTEQLQFLADQLKPTGGSDAFSAGQTQHGHPGSHDLTMTDHDLDQSGHSHHSHHHQHHHHFDSGINSSRGVSSAPTFSTTSTVGSSIGSLASAGGAYSTTISPTSYADLPAVDPKITDPLYVLRVKSLPILDNLSTQILNTLGRGAYMDAIAVATQPDTDQGQAFQILMSLFEQTKSIYSEDAFLSARDLHLNKTREYSIIIQKTNLATFVSAVFGAAKVGFFHLNENFLDTFVVDNGRLLKPQGALFLDLKTQAYISAMGQVERSQREILDDLFPEDIDRILLARRQSTKVLAPSEADFVARCRRRREHLAAIDTDTEDISLKYSWLAFVRDLSEYISKNSQMILTGKSAKAAAAAQKQQGDYEGGRGIDGNGKRIRSAGNDDLHRRMSGISMENGGSINGGDLTMLDNANAVDDAGREDHQNQTGSQSPNSAAGQGSSNSSSNGVNNFTGSANRQSATAATTTSTATTTIGTGSATRAPFYQRRPWTSEEEEALMSGLNAVRGPHWSQILELYGAGGRISEVLKDRNQVQLKDKARNLKLFFLKTGVQMPDVLRFVTGDVKSREKSAAGGAGGNGASGNKRGRKSTVSKTQKQKAQAKQYQMYRAQQRFQQQQQEQQQPQLPLPELQQQTLKEQLHQQQEQEQHQSPQDQSQQPPSQQQQQQNQEKQQQQSQEVHNQQQQLETDIIDTSRTSVSEPTTASATALESAQGSAEEPAPVQASASGQTAVDEKEDESANLLTLMQQVGEYLDNHSNVAVANGSNNSADTGTSTTALSTTPSLVGTASDSVTKE